MHVKILMIIMHRNIENYNVIGVMEIVLLEIVEKEIKDMLYHLIKITLMDHRLIMMNALEIEIELLANVRK